MAGFRPELWREAASDDAPSEFEGSNQGTCSASTGLATPATQYYAGAVAVGERIRRGFFDVARAAIAEPRGSAPVGEETSSWPYRHDPDLTGFIEEPRIPRLL